MPTAGQERSLFPEPAAREPEALLASALAVIDQGFAAAATGMLPLFSGGHDSLCACHVASRHPRFDRKVHHIDTGIGAKRTREHVEATCRELGWELVVWKSNATYERFVSRLGFPGPGSHQWVYTWLKDRCVQRMTRGRGKVILATGTRSQESVRRMGHVQPVKIGERSKKTGILRRPNRIWVAPCHDWTTADQHAYMAEHDLPTNPLKIALGMSGECFCGAFASPGEIDRVRRHAPDVAAEIDRLAAIAGEAGKHAVWGTRPPSQKKGLVVAESGPLCSTCEHKARAAGLLFDNTPEGQS